MYCNIFFAPFHQFEWENPKKDLIVGEMTLGISEQVCLNYMSDEEHLTLNERSMPKLMSWAKKAQIQECSHDRRLQSEIQAVSKKRN